MNVRTVQARDGATVVVIEGVIGMRARYFATDTAAVIAAVTLFQSVIGWPEHIEFCTEDEARQRTFAGASMAAWRRA